MYGLLLAVRGTERKEGTMNQNGNRTRDAREVRRHPSTQSLVGYVVYVNTGLVWNFYHLFSFFFQILKLEEVLRRIQHR